MKRVLVFTLSILFLFAGVVLAQSRRAPGAMRGPGAPGMPRGGDPLAEYLDLSAEQKAAWEAIRAETHETIAPLHEQGETLAEQLESTNDAAGIGNIVLQLRALSSQIEAAREAGDAKFAATLSAEQKMKFEAFQAASQFLHRRGPGGPPPPLHH
ncbi:MAG: Spy/CpxP family protein refolding chaperone [Thermoanaerobaculia bacterium]